MGKQPIFVSSPRFRSSKRWKGRVGLVLTRAPPRGPTDSRLLSSAPVPRVWAAGDRSPTGLRWENKKECKKIEKRKQKKRKAKQGRSALSRRDSPDAGPRPLGESLHLLGVSLHPSRRKVSTSQPGLTTHQTPQGSPGPGDGTGAGGVGDRRDPSQTGGSGSSGYWRREPTGAREAWPPGTDRGTGNPRNPR